MNFIYHHLNVNPSVIPKKQPPRHSSKDHSDAIKDKVIKLKQSEAIKNVFYPEWLANTIVVKKKNGKWRVCVNFTNLSMWRVCKSSSDEFFRCLLEIPPNTTSSG